MRSKLNNMIKRSDIFPAVFFSFCWIWLIGLTYYASSRILDADASNVLVMSNVMAHGNSIVSTGWRYYTELHVLNMQLVYSFFFHFFEDWSVVRFLGDITLQALLLASYWFLCKQTKISRAAIFYSATVLLIPCSVTYTRIVLLHGYYPFHFTIAFFIIGLLLKLASNHSQKKLGWIISAILFFVLCFMGGINGMRQLYISIAPAFLVCVYLYLRSEEFLKILITERTPTSNILPMLYRSIKATAEGRGLVFSIFGAIANIVGIAINVFILRKFFGFSTYYSLKTIAPNAGELNEKINDLLNLFGYRNGAPVFSLEGVSSLLAVLTLAFVIGCSIWYFVRVNKNEAYRKRFASVLFLCALLIQSLVFLITANYFIHYYTPVFILVALFIAILIDEFPMRSIRLPRYCAGVMLFAFLISGAITTNFLVNKPEEYATKYEGLVYSNINQVQQIKPAIAYLQNNGYTFGYSYYWDSSIVTELTNGRIEVCAIVETPEITYSYANTKKAFWDVNYHQGKTFFLFQSSCTDWLDYPILQGGTEVYSDEFYRIIEYPSPIAFERSRFAD